MNISEQRKAAERQAARGIAKWYVAGSQKSLDRGMSPAWLRDRWNPENVISMTVACHYAVGAFEPGNRMAGFKYSHKSAQRITQMLESFVWEILRDGAHPELNLYALRRDEELRNALLGV